jgi:hypothetical protein
MVRISPYEKGVPMATIRTTTAKTTTRDQEFEETFGYDPEKKIFGLMQYEAFTMICYHVDDYFVPKRILARTRSNGGNFVLHMGARMVIHADELERVFRDLGMIEEKK